AYQEVGEFDRAITLLERIRQANPDEPTYDAYLAQTLIAAGQSAKALEIVSAKRREFPEDFRFARLEADAVAKSGRVDEAVKLLQQAVTRLPQRPDTHLGLAALCVEYKRFDCADAALDRAESQFPGNITVIFQRGAFFEHQEQYANAEKVFRSVL